MISKREENNNDFCPNSWIHISHLILGDTHKKDPTTFSND